MFIRHKHHQSNQTAILQRLMVLVLLVSIFGLIDNVYAPAIQNFKVFVHVDTPEEDKTEKLIIESHIKRELRALGDVAIVDLDDDWQFSILISALGASYKDGRKASSIAIARSVNMRVPKKLFKSYDFPLLHIPVYSNDLHVSIWQRDSLAEWCVLQVNDFDKEHLKIFRDSR